MTGWSSTSNTLTGVGVISAPSSHMPVGKLAGHRGPPFGPVRLNDEPAAQPLGLLPHVPEALAAHRVVVGETGPVVRNRHPQAVALELQADADVTRVGVAERVGQGGGAWPAQLDPQHATEPSVLTPQVWPNPALTEVNSSDGGVACPTTLPTTS